MKPYYDHAGIALYHGDCVDVMRGMDDLSVDCVITDPPYGLGFPYHDYEDTRPNLVALIEGFLPEARRIARERVIVLCGPTQIGLYPQADWVGAVVWNTTGSYGRYGFTQWTPLVFYGADLPGTGSTHGPVNGHLRSDVIAIRGVAGGFPIARTAEEKQHTCPKPLSMMRRIIGRYTRPGSVILDCFSGSGSTGVACLMEGRGFIGIEKNVAYIELSMRRLAAAPLSFDFGDVA